MRGFPTFLLAFCQKDEHLSFLDITTPLFDEQTFLHPIFQTSFCLIYQYLEFDLFTYCFGEEVLYALPELLHAI